MFKEQRRTTRSRYALRNLANLEYWIDLDRYALEFARGFQAFDKFAQVPIGHDGPPRMCLVKQPHSVARFNSRLSYRLDDETLSKRVLCVRQQRSWGRRVFPTRACRDQDEFGRVSPSGRGSMVEWRLP